MPKDLRDFPRPPSDNGRGLVGSASSDWQGGDEGYDYWIGELVALGIKWFKILDDNGNSLTFCEKLLAAGIFPIVRIIRRDPPPNDTPEPNPGHIGRPEEETLRRLIAAGVRYFETNNEPDRDTEWKHNAMPTNPLEAAKLVALNWLFDARFILEAGGLPGLPAISNGGNLDLIGALATLGKQNILLEGCWIALHNDCLNRPLDYPENPVIHFGAPLTPEQYDLGAFTNWAWWNASQNRPDTRDQVNAARDGKKNPTQAIQQDHACFREFEFYNSLAMKYLGRSIPIISTGGGYRVGQRPDSRYPRITPDSHRDLTVAMFDMMQRQAPDYYFAATPTQFIESPGHASDAWHSAFWKTALKIGNEGRNGFPGLVVLGAEIGDHLPVIAAVKAMPNLARRLPGTQPAPPLAPEQRVERPGLAYLVSDAPTPAAPVPDSPPREPVVVEPTRAPQSRATTPPPAPIVAPSITPEPRVVTPPRPLKPETPTPVPVAPPIEPGTIPAYVPISRELEWDFRLDALNLTLEPAEARVGETYWKLVVAVYEGPGESSEGHHVFYTLLDEQDQPIANQRVWQGWTDNQTDAVTDERGTTNIPLWQSFAPEQDEVGPYQAWVDGLPSDRVIGLGLPLKRHVNFRLTWRRARKRS